MFEMKSSDSFLQSDMEEQRNAGLHLKDSVPTYVSDAVSTVPTVKRSFLSNNTEAFNNTDGGTLISLTEDLKGLALRKTSQKGGHLQLSPFAVNYHGVNIFKAALDGNLPLCVLLWGLASAKRINLIVNDSAWNNPVHYAANADTPEVRSVFSMKNILVVILVYHCMYPRC